MNFYTQKYRFNSIYIKKVIIPFYNFFWNYRIFLSAFLTVIIAFGPKKVLAQTNKKHPSTIHNEADIKAAHKNSADSVTTDLLKKYVKHFNATQPQHVVNYIPDSLAYSWLSKNIPLFSCPDSVIQQIYYYRWWTFRKHLVKTPEGFIFTEFITNVSFSGIYNTDSSALGHHIYEGRWLHNPKYLNQYIWFWLLHDRYESHSELHNYSQWLENAIYHRYLVNKDSTFVVPLITDLDRDYRKWEKQRQEKNGMYWQYDVRDAMESSISGGRHVKNIRPTINSYMYGNAKALSKLAAIARIDSLKKEYHSKAKKLKRLVEKNLWNKKAHFFEVLEAKQGRDTLSNVREEIGYIPWYFDLPADSSKYAQAWLQLRDTSGFKAPYGITTAERRSPKYMEYPCCHSEWDGPVWPFATTQTLIGLANLLNNYHRQPMTKQDYFRLLKQYAVSQHKHGKPYIGEYQSPTTGKWLRGNNPRSRYYNHSDYCNLIITGLVGLRPRSDNTIEVNPLIPQGKWKWFCLDNVKYHHHFLTITWDKTGKKYHRGKGLRVYVDGKLIIHSKTLKKVYGKIPSS